MLSRRDLLAGAAATATLPLAARAQVKPRVTFISQWSSGSDGAAITGVSGGAVLFSNSADGVQIVGVVSAYHHQANALPGLVVARDVSLFHSIAEQVKSIDEAERKKAEFDKIKQEEASKEIEMGLKLPPSSRPEDFRPNG